MWNSPRLATPSVFNTLNIFLLKYGNTVKWYHSYFSALCYAVAVFFILIINAECFAFINANKRIKISPAVKMTVAPLGDIVFKYKSAVAAVLITHRHQSVGLAEYFKVALFIIEIRIMPSGCIILDDRTFFTRLGRLEYVVIAVAFSVLSYYKSIYLSCRFYRTAAVNRYYPFIRVDYRQIVFFPLAKL